MRRFGLITGFGKVPDFAKAGSKVKHTFYLLKFKTIIHLVN